MHRCAHWDCGWCYANKDVKNNSCNGMCIDPKHCPKYIKDEETLKEKK